MSLSNPNPRTNPPPRSLDVKKFAESRSQELESLHSVVADRLNHDFKIHRSKRRRTTSYRSSKHKIRKASALAADPNPKPKTSRRVRRRLELQSNPESGFVRSGDGTRRLRTHMWHAKRFKMVKIWGFHLPLGVQGRGRGSRAVLKWLKCGALVHDASYCCPIQLEGPEDSISAMLRTVLLPLPSSFSEDMSHSAVYGVHFNNAMLHHVGLPPSHFIAPVLYMWRPFIYRDGHVTAEEDPVSSGCCVSAKHGPSSSARQLWIWIHAAAFEEGLSALRAACQKQMSESGISVYCYPLEGHIAKLEAMGSKATQILQKILHPVSKTVSRSDPWWSTCSSLTASTAAQVQKPLLLQNAEHLPSHAILSLDVHDPRNLPPKETEVELGTTTTESDLKGTDIQNLNPSICGVSFNSESVLALWSKPETNGVFLSDSRRLWDSSEKLNPPLPENILCMDRHHKRLKHFNLDAVNDEKSASQASDGFGQSCPILLLKHSSKGNFNARWTIVLPLSWVKAFWMALVNHGAHAIGLRERRWIACDSGLPCFPYDFPDCKAYSLLMAAEAAASDDSAELRPLAVRPPRVPIPPPWDCIESTCKQGNANTAEVVAQPSTDVHPSSPLISDSASSEQSHKLFDGFIPRYSSALNEYLRKIQGSSIDQMSSASALCLVRVLVRAYKEGVFEEGAVVCAPIASDMPRWDRSSEDEEPLQIPASLVKSYFTLQNSGKWELLLPENCSTLDSYRWPIGFITTGFVRGSKKPTAVAFCEAKLLAQLREQQSKQTMQDEARPEICVLVRNLRSSAYRRALATIVLEGENVDTEFM